MRGRGACVKLEMVTSCHDELHILYVAFSFHCVLRGAQGK